MRFLTKREVEQAEYKIDAGVKRLSSTGMAL